MTLFKLALANIKKSIKDYAIYFFTLILGVAIFYVFNAIETQTVMIDISADTRDIVDLMTSMLSGISVFVAFILGFLIIYASRFLMKRRHQEFGIYLLLGMSKQKISLILFFETIFIGIFSLGVGLIVGIMLSQLMSIFVANLFAVDMTQFEFVFSPSACKQTLLYFSIIYVIVILFNVFMVGKCQLIELLQSHRKEETIQLKNPWLCGGIFLISVILLGVAYSMVTTNVNDVLETPKLIVMAIGLGCIGTFLVFWSLSGFLIKLVQKIKPVYFKELNSFTLRQISSKINTMVFNMTIICLMIFITICDLSSCFAMQTFLSRDINELAPADIQITQRMNFDESYLDQGYLSEQIKNSVLDVYEVLSAFDIQLEDYLSESVEYHVYRDPQVTLEATLGSQVENIKANNSAYVMLPYNNLEQIVPLSEYNKVAAFYGNETYTLNENEYMIVVNFESMAMVRDMALAYQEPLEIFGHNLTPKYTSCQDGFIAMSGSHTNGGVLIVPDSVVEGQVVSSHSVIGNYTMSSIEERRAFENRIANIYLDERGQSYITPIMDSRLMIEDNSIGLSALVTFVGLYLGIIFLLASAAILALKELTESNDNKERYQMLRKLGADEKMLNRALFRQIFTFFTLPLFLAIVHSIFGIQFCYTIMNTYTTDNLFSSILMTAMVLLVIYGGYFILTYFYSRYIIRERS